MSVRLGDREVRLTRAEVRFPVELRTPPTFDRDEPSSWPEVDGRLELVDGRLLFMPPTGDVQQDVAVDVAYILRSWTAEHPGFVVGGNEAGMLLGGDVRGADAAIWRRADLGTHTGGYRRVPPVLAVEIAGRDDDEPTLRDKAAWYLRNGVGTVWLVLPATRSVVVIDAAGATTFTRGRLPPTAGLDGLEVDVERFFAQLDGR